MRTRQPRFHLTTSGRQQNTVNGERSKITVRYKNACELLQERSVDGTLLKLMMPQQMHVRLDKVSPVRDNKGGLALRHEYQV